ncbi:porin [Paraburkholderia sp. J12]|uniref:porin n=1 Tax=Paraburkholderia sp. J12 TaxID=2805432 RepID=UPI002ABD392B|nr:porin [Paraburkholderia sp. J12]
MKAKKLALVALLATVSGYAGAQSSVTLYGLLDTGLAYVSNVGGGHRFSTIDGAHAPDLYGIRGVEDLGGGLSTIFDLEGQFTISNGQVLIPGELFSWKSMVGLKSNDLGTLTLGHQPTFMFDVMAPFTTAYQAGSMLSLHQGNLDELASLYPANNTVKYASPSYHGASFGAQFIFGGQPGNFAIGRGYSFFMRYENGPFSIGGVYANENDRLLDGTPFIGLKTILGTPLPGEVVANNIENWGVGTSYTWGQWALHAAFTQSRVTLMTGSGNANTVDAGVTWHPVPFDQLGVGTAIENFSGGHWNTYSVVNSYFVSKRTSLYQQVVYQHASGSGAVASLGGIGPSSGASQLCVNFGITHAF